MPKHKLHLQLSSDGNTWYEIESEQVHEVCKQLAEVAEHLPHIAGAGEKILRVVFRTPEQETKGATP